MVIVAGRSDKLRSSRKQQGLPGRIGTLGSGLGGDGDDGGGDDGDAGEGVDERNAQPAQ